MRCLASLAVAATALATVAACGGPETPMLMSPSDEAAAPGAAPPAKIGERDGLVYLAIPAKLGELSDGFARIRALGSSQGKNIAVDIELTRRAIVLRSVGADSDALLEALGRAYQVTPPKPHMRGEVEWPIEVVDGQIASADRNRLRLKATIDTGLKSEFAELFITFDPTRNALELTEKDPSFRTNVLRGLGQ
jgi:hypothetical protein